MFFVTLFEYLFCIFFCSGVGDLGSFRWLSHDNVCLICFLVEAYLIVDFHRFVCGCMQLFWRVHIDCFSHMCSFGNVQERGLHQTNYKYDFAIVYDTKLM